MKRPRHPAAQDGWRRDWPAHAGAHQSGDATLRPRAAIPQSLFETCEFDITDEQFDHIRLLARRHAGIVIAEFKRSMVWRRVRRRLAELKLATFDDYWEILKGPDAAKELQPLINALTTNKTSFFREAHHFDHLRAVAIPAIASARRLSPGQPLRIWSAGCSTGEEAWSIAISASDACAAMPDGSFEVLASDIDTNVLAAAKRGRYRSGDLAVAPPSARLQHFQRAPGDADHVEPTPKLRSRLRFQQINLHDSWPVRRPVDIIFCRNVVIYFDKPSQRLLYDRFANLLSADGFLYCGHSESLHGVSRRFEPVGRSIYKRIA